MVSICFIALSSLATFYCHLSVKKLPIRLLKFPRRPSFFSFTQNFLTWDIKSFLKNRETDLPGQTFVNHNSNEISYGSNRISTRHYVSESILHRGEMFVCLTGFHHSFGKYYLENFDESFQQTDWSIVFGIFFVFFYYKGVTFAISKQSGKVLLLKQSLKILTKKGSIISEQHLKMSSPNR